MLQMNQLKNRNNKIMSINKKILILILFFITLLLIGYSTNYLLLKNSITTTGKIIGQQKATKGGYCIVYLFSVKGQNIKGAPVNAILLQTVISISIILLFNFGMILQYIELTLSLFCLLTVIGVFVIRHKKMGDDTTIKTWGYPFTPIIFIAVTLWMIFYFVHMEPVRLFWTFVTILFAVIVYFLSSKNSE
jgi:hypothetical protein